MNASYSKTNDISMQILTALAGENSGYATLGCMLTIARLQRPDEHLHHDFEVRFLQDAMD